MSAEARRQQRYSLGLPDLAIATLVDGVVMTVDTGRISSDSARGKVGRFINP